MRKLATRISLLFLFVLVASATTVAQSQNPQRYFDQANQQLEQGNIRQALATYHQLERQNQVSGALFFNMGLSYTQLDSMGKAKYYFLRSKQFDEIQDRAEAGLEYVESRFSHQSAVLPELPWNTALRWLQTDLGTVPLLGIGLIVFNIGLLGFAWLWWTNHRATWAFRSTVGTAAVGLLVVMLSFYTHYHRQRYSKAVMITREASVRKQPAPDAVLVNEAYEGYTFVVDHSKSRDKPNWSYIRMSNGLYGWIPTKEIMIL